MTAVLQYSIPPLYCEDAMRDPKVIEGTIAADWWILAGALQALLNRDYYRYDDAPSSDSGLKEDGYDFAIYERGQPDHVLARVVFSIGPSPTPVRIEAQRLPGVYAYCEGLYQFLDLLAGGADIIRRRFQPTADNAIETYYRSRAAGSKITLRQLAVRTGYSYDYLRKAKRRYDAAGRWGSKKEPTRGSLESDI
jgi:hypothetical protein